MSLKTAGAEAAADAFNASGRSLAALEAAASGHRVCELASCAKTFTAKKRWARFCCPACRKAHYDHALKLKHIHEYLSELGKKGAAARKAKRAA